MDDISARIKKLVNDYADGNNSKFAQIVGTSEVNVRNYINGTQPKYEFLNKVANKLKIDCEWLLLGNLRKNAVEEPSGRGIYIPYFINFIAVFGNALGNGNSFKTENPA